MDKNLKLSYICLTVLTSAMVAWLTLTNYFGGAGVTFVAIAISFIVLSVLYICEVSVRARIKYSYFIALFLVAVETILFFALEFGVDNEVAFKILIAIQKVVIILAVMFLVYVVIRFVCDAKGYKIGFIEQTLGGGKPAKKEKRAKELTNGTLEDKPNNLNREAEVEELSTKETDAENKEE